MLRVLVNCPGGWSHGLDSPERGEGRWAQNLTRLLARSGRYDVSACSGGVPTWGRGIVEPGVKLLSEQEAEAQGPYDLHFDAAWYDKKKPAGAATHNFHVHFGYEPRLGVPFPDKHYLVYVLKAAGPNYFGEGRGNADRTFYVPTPFGERFASPDYSRRRILHTMRGSDAPGRLNRFEQLYEVVSRLRREMEVPLTWISSVGLEEPRHAQDSVLAMDKAWGIPYCELRAVTAGCGLNAALDGWSNTLDAMSLGVPSLVWTGGVDSSCYGLASKYDLLLDSQSTTTERLFDVVRRMFVDPMLYTNFTLDVQNEFRDHMDWRVLALFDEMVAKVMK